MKIVIDAMGGDYAPKVMVEGAVNALKTIKDIEIILTGKEDVILPFLENVNNERLKIVNATQIIENDESPVQAVKDKTDSSLVKAYEILKNGEADALISAGSTGAILVGGFTKIGRIKGVSRPALAPLLPTKKGSQVLLLDVGANMDSKAINLEHFAIIGSSYMKACFNIKNPKVALLNVGSEEEKGNEFTKEVFTLLKENKNINFVGNTEARYITSGDFDVVVADGFAGNVALKAMEGAVSLAMGEVKSAFKGLRGKIAGLMVKSKLKRTLVKLDYNKYGGSPFLGCKKIIIKSHGSSKTETITASIKQAYNLFNSKFIEKLEGEISAQ